ncbi:glycoside hydrolase family 55 protein, partial [bacterium]|nr:glycoside hydrolase family 55 protein [bacterium]
MNFKENVITVVFFLLSLFLSIQESLAQSVSIYKQKLSDPEAFYFTPENYAIKADGKMDVSDSLQSAINKLKTEKNFGILFIPEGTYLISKTIYIPNAIRLVGYGKNRPLFVLGKNSPGYQVPDPDDKANANYMFWFTSGLITPGQPIRDAGAGTFYSAFSNIDLKIEAGNPTAIALRTHYAQHGYISHCDIHIGDGKAGIFDVGNEMEDVRFFGGDYGILTTTPSPSWPMMMVDTYFEGQRLAAIRTRNAGLAIVNMHAKNVPIVIEIEPDMIERLFMENCLFEDISSAGIMIGYENNSLNQINLMNIDCRNVTVLVKYRSSGKQQVIHEKIYKVKRFTYGLCMDDMIANAEYQTIIDIESLKVFPERLTKDIPPLPDTNTWVNIRDLGAKGDGETDDTQIFQEAIAKYKNIYVPQGWYRLTETLKMAPHTCLIGLHPFGTQFVLAESTPAFSGFGGPKSLIESSEGGNDIFTGIGINTGAYNYRAVGMKWMAGAGSLLNDVKFVGGHGTMQKGPLQPYRSSRTVTISSPTSPVIAQGKDLAWDNQYWSLWITRNGGGTLKDIWTANTYAASGLYVNNTSTSGRIYAMTLEHHVRNEARFDHVSNWKIYAFQLEEESREGVDCQPVDLINCKDIVFANLWQFRVIRVNTPRLHGVRLWNCENIEFLNAHTYAQVMYVTEIPFYDINKDLNVYPWEFARLTVTGKEPSHMILNNEIGKVQKLASGFEFAEGITNDSKGNIYFCENRLRRIYKWSVETNS